MAGFQGHRDRLERDDEYATKMECYPAEFCDDVIEELRDFDVWVNAQRPANKERRADPPAKGSGKVSGAKGSGAKGWGKDKNKAKGKGKYGKDMQR